MQFHGPASRRCVGRVAARATLTLGLLLTTPLSPALAQSDSLPALSQQIERLQREVQVLQRQVAVGQPSGDLRVPDGEAGTLLFKLNDIETELRRLTGRVEELSYRLEQTGSRLDTMEARLDTRVGALENRPAEADARPLMQGQEAGGQRVLGTLPESSAGTAGNAMAGSQPVDRSATQEAALPAVQLPGTSAKDDYDYAFGLLRQADYPRAEAALRAFLAAHPEDALAGNAKYWLGETHYVRGDYKTAAVVFAEGFQEYPDSSKAPDNLLKLGMALSSIGERDDACNTYAALLARYPDAAATVRQRAERERGRLGC